MTMKKPILNAIYLLAFAPLLIQCAASQQTVNSLELRLRTVDNRLVGIDRELTNLQDKAGESAPLTFLDTIQKRQAELGNTVDRLQSELLQVKGKIEETTYRARNVQDENTQVRSTLAAQLNETGTRIAALEKQLADTNGQIDELKKSRAEDAVKLAEIQAKITAERTAEAARFSAEKAALEARLASEKSARLEAEKKARPPVDNNLPKTKKKGGPKETTPTSESLKKQEVETPEPSSPPVEGPSGGEPGQELYDTALGLFKAKNFKQAHNEFSEYLSQFPNTGLAVNARFWMGDSLFNQNEFELAILEYQKVIAEHPAHAKAPAAMLKQGLAFEKLQDLETAKIIYQKLLNDYPKSEQVEAAKKHLETLKK